MDPWVSTLIACPRDSAAWVSFSAAIYVWAIPVGQAVTASSFSPCPLFPAPLGGTAGLVVTCSPNAPRRGRTRVLPFPRPGHPAPPRNRRYSPWTGPGRAHTAPADRAIHRTPPAPLQPRPHGSSPV